MKKKKNHGANKSKVNHVAKATERVKNRESDQVKHVAKNNGRNRVSESKEPCK